LEPCFYDVLRLREILSRLHTAGVAGSIPAAPTIYSSCFKGLWQSTMTVSVGNSHLAHPWHSEESIWPLSGSVERDITHRSGSLAIPLLVRLFQVLPMLSAGQQPQRSTWREISMWLQQKTLQENFWIAMRKRSLLDIRVMRSRHAA